MHSQLGSRTGKVKISIESPDAVPLAPANARMAKRDTRASNCLEPRSPPLQPLAIVRGRW